MLMFLKKSVGYQGSGNFARGVGDAIVVGHPGGVVVPVDLREVHRGERGAPVLLRGREHDARVLNTGWIGNRPREGRG